jgi:hypothetical protein
MRDLPPHDVHVQVTAEQLTVLSTYAPMSVLVALMLFYDFSVCGGSIMLDGGQSDTPAKLVVEAGAYTRPLFSST